MADCETESDAQRSPKQVLVLEDLPVAQAVIRQLIEESGALRICAFCETEMDALEQFERLVPDVVIIDLKLRQGSGLGFLRRRARRVGYHPLLMVMTNHAMPAIEVACREAGAHHFFDKSKDLPLVGMAIENWMATRSASVSARPGE